MTRSLMTPILWVFLSRPIQASQELRKNEIHLDLTQKLESED